MVQEKLALSILTQRACAPTDASSHRQTRRTEWDLPNARRHRIGDISDSRTLLKDIAT